MIERDLHGYAGNPPAVWWPGKARVALSLVVNYEEGSELAIGDGDATRERSRWVQPLTIRDLAAESMYEYGSRAGFWRLMRIFDQAGVPATFYACAVALERNRIAAKAIPRAGHEVMSQGYRWEDVTLLTREEERWHMEMALESLTETTGETPTGWCCRYGPSVNTRELVVDNPHLQYDCDAYNDDLPFWTDMNGTAHLVVPHSLANNDIKFETGAFGSPRDYEDYLCANLDQLYAEGAETPKMMSVGIHMRLAGLPGRAQALKNFIAYAQSLGGVWFARRDEIAAHWREHFPAEKGQAA
jgi:peptidoglycan/xylan/chitin deacetylase (PgdA/CDA1 family)